VEALGLGAGGIERRGCILHTAARREVAGQQVARVVVDDRDRIPLPVPRDMQVGHIRLPQLVRVGRQQLEQARRLVECRLAQPRLLQQY
jgi:hypothetical protein